MKHIATFLLLLAYSNAWRLDFHEGRRYGGNVIPPPSEPSTKDIKTLYFKQKLDHFDSPNDPIEWNQRYFVKDSFATDNKIAFLFIGGESEASVAWMSTGAWIEDAKTHGALCFQLEHRYYGKSIPTADLSTENLRYLTSRQALADMASFIEGMNKLHNLAEDVKWIVYGGSYAGNLAAWMRQLYPSLVVGASASSAPVLAQLDFKEYYGVIAKDLVALHSQKCADVVQKASDQIAALLTSDPAKLNTLFNLCDPIEESLDNPQDVAGFWSALAINFAGIAQYNNPAHELNIAGICKSLTSNPQEDEIDRLAEFNKLVHGTSCINYKYDNLINYLNITAMDQGGSRQWKYQTCTEFGYYQTSNQAPQIFGNGFPLNHSVQQCIDVFGPKYNEAFIQNKVGETNSMYGGLNPYISNVIYVHGTVDPWHALGVLHDVNGAATSIVVTGTSHCQNMYSMSISDPPELAAAKQKAHDVVAQWLQS